MSDTITVWFTEAEDSPPGAASPSAEIHLNLWRHSARRGGAEDFLDVGVLIRNAESLGTLGIYLPFPIRTEPADLVGLMHRNPNLLRGVFNEVVELGRELSNDAFTINKGGSHYLTCHGGLGNERLAMDSVEDDGTERGTALTFSDAFCEGMRSPGAQYIRFRVSLSRDASEAFSFKEGGAEGLLSPTFKQREYTEIRFNEMRSVREELRTLLEMGFVMPIDAVHVFLMRDMAFELLATHSAPHKVRRLEDDLWKGYAPHRFDQVLGRFVVYHWKKEFEAPTHGQSVVVFAKFAHEPTSLATYAIGIVLLGATGSAFQASIVSWMPGKPVFCSFIVLAILTLLLYGFTIRSELRRRFEKFWKRRGRFRR